MNESATGVLQGGPSGLPPVSLGLEDFGLKNDPIPYQYVSIQTYAEEARPNNPLGTGRFMKDMQEIGIDEMCHLHDMMRKKRLYDQLSKPGHWYVAGALILRWLEEIGQLERLTLPESTTSVGETSRPPTDGI